VTAGSSKTVGSSCDISSAVAADPGRG
jgi:hypothetical protein